MAIAFVLIYPEGEGEDGVRWVEQPRKIVAHYLRGWFAIDSISIGVSAVDIVVLVGASEAGEGSTGGDQGNGQGKISGLRALRALRALRLIKLIRIFRASRIFTRWENKFAINYTALEVAKCLVAMLVAAHWFGCFWSLQVISSITTGPDSTISMLICHDVICALLWASCSHANLLTHSPLFRGSPPVFLPRHRRPSSPRPSSTVG